MSARSLVILAAGPKGVLYLRKLLSRGITPVNVFSYRDERDAVNSFEKLLNLAASVNVPLCHSKRPSLSPNFLYVAVGWQFLLDNSSENLIVLHDSFLPRYRGFAPTVAALIRGEREIGVTALKPVKGVDAGPVYGQLKRAIDYPIKIAEALEIQVELMVQLTAELLKIAEQGQLVAVEQDHARATYSIWRDDTDFIVDWAQSAPDIQRFVNALGCPYAGARTRYRDQDIILNDVEVVSDLPFEIRQPGKVWQVVNGAAIVVCGVGLLKITNAQTIDGQSIAFKTIRNRLG